MAVSTQKKTAGLHVLVVDDDRDNAETMAMLIRIWGHDVRVAHDGAAALSVAEAEHPDAIFLDIAMPGMSGLELMTRLRAHRGEVLPLLVAVSGFAGERSEAEALEAGAHLFLAKPASPRVIRRVIDRLQDLRQAT